MSATSRITYLDALALAQREEMARDSSVIILGEDISLYAGGGAYGDVDSKRIRSAPISENGFSGMAVGAAITGAADRRPDHRELYLSRIRPNHQSGGQVTLYDGRTGACPGHIPRHDVAQTGKCGAAF